MNTKWKIQIDGMRGWYDTRFNDGSDDKYHVDLFDTREEAEAEARVMASSFGPDDEYSHWRVVPEATPEDWSPYCDI